MRSFFLFIVILLSACSNESQQEPARDNFDNITKLNTAGEQIPLDNTEAVEHRKVMILAKSGFRPATIMLEYGGEVEQSYEEMNMVAGLIPVDQLENLKQDARIMHLEIDKPVELKPAQVLDWGGVRLQVPNSLASNFTGSGVKIAVIDTGIAIHEDLKIVNGISLVDYTTSFHDDNGHGTHVAGIIGAKNNAIGVVGVAPDSELYAVKVLDQDGTGYLSDVIAGIDWSIQNGMDIINLSLGSNQASPLLETMINKAVSQNMVIVSATGNEGTAAGDVDTVSYPARYTNVIGVGAVDKTNKRASFSSTGSAVEFVAPGVSILSSYVGNSYARMDGTSSATPYVTGVIALLKQINPTITLQAIRTELRNESIDLGSVGRDSWYGFGLVQAPYYFKDIYGHWARNDILTVYEKQWMVGLPDQYFYPSRALTRAEGAAIISRILGLQQATSGEMPFTDVSIKHWAYQDIRTVYQDGLMVGITPNQFQPGKYLTREQMVVMLSRIFSNQQTTRIPFTDVALSRWSYQAIASMYGMGIISGVTPTSFAPAKSVTRAEMAAMLNRISPHLGE
ncbi:S8 family peptidase [Ornithinibacillus xuwenensis]|uniref:S8 family serine peptidase n=1 Tax=Ornithinibacillus xuwenensis TaxID=3144668 RepID=A0ABU9XH63_9BACI